MAFYQFPSCSLTLAVSSVSAHTHTHMFIHVRQLDACLYVPGVPPQCIPSALFQSITVLMPSLTLAASVYTWALLPELEAAQGLSKLF